MTLVRKRVNRQTLGDLLEELEAAEILVENAKKRLARREKNRDAIADRIAALRKTAR